MSKEHIQHCELFNAISAALFEADPIGINFGTNTDEYDPETRTIIPRLAECHDITGLQQVVYQEFVHWFGEDAGTIGDYQQIAATIWGLWHKAEA